VVTDLRGALIARAEGSARIDLREDSRFPELVAPFVPPDFNYELRYPSRLITNEETSQIYMDLSLVFWPRGSRRSPNNTCSAGRTVSTEALSAHHRYLTIAEDLQGRGIGRRLIREACALYATLDIPEVRLMAVDVGRYAWAMAGFEPIEEMRADVVENIVEAAQELGFVLEGFDLSSPLWDLDLIDEYVTAAEIVQTLGGELEIPASIAESSETPIRLSKALLLCSRSVEWVGQLGIGDSRGYNRMLAYTES
jgi:hypothetical protein